MRRVRIEWRFPGEVVQDVTLDHVVRHGLDKTGHFYQAHYDSEGNDAFIRIPLAVIRQVTEVIVDAAPEQESEEPTREVDFRGHIWRISEHAERPHDNDPCEHCGIAWRICGQNDGPECDGGKTVLVPSPPPEDETGGLLPQFGSYLWRNGHTWPLRGDRARPASSESCTVCGVSYQEGGTRRDGKLCPGSKNPASGERSNLDRGYTAIAGHQWQNIPNTNTPAPQSRCAHCGGRWGAYKQVGHECPGGPRPVPGGGGLPEPTITGRWDEDEHVWTLYYDKKLPEPQDECWHCSLRFDEYLNHPRKCEGSR